jgi:hypothetical protein
MELSWITASSPRLILDFFNYLIILFQLIDKNNLSNHFSRKMLSRSNYELTPLLEEAFRSFNLLFRIIKNATEKVPSFCLFSYSQLFLETTAKFIDIENSYSFGIFEKIWILET